MGECRFVSTFCGLGLSAGLDRSAGHRRFMTKRARINAKRSVSQGV